MNVKPGTGWVAQVPAAGKKCILSHDQIKEFNNDNKLMLKVKTHTTRYSGRS